MQQSVTVCALLDLTKTLAAPLFEGKTYPFEVLPLIKDFILALGPTLDPADYKDCGNGVWIARSAVVAPTAYIGGPCVIGPQTEVRHGAFIRGSALVGAGAVVGNSTELKNCILFDGVQVPHYNYVGDSVLGYKAHMGAGAITANVKADKSNVTLRCRGEAIPTGLRKFGALLGDGADVGCNSVLAPGTVIGRGSRIYPLSMVRGEVPAGHIYKDARHLVKIK